MKRYEWKDLLTDSAIIAVVIGLILLLVGSFPQLFSKIIPFIT